MAAAAIVEIDVLSMVVVVFMLWGKAQVSMFDDLMEKEKKKKEQRCDTERCRIPGVETDCF
jgi:NTP pyrophosphatase (non-canonical NTP hydrolase)